jgi:DNA-binding response OmpR family regulator
MDVASVLVVESNLHTCRALERLLKSRGFRVHCAQTFAQAKAALDSQLPGFVLLDLRLPDGNATALIDVIRERDATKTTRIAVMPGLVDLMASDEHKLTRADTVLAKPFRAEALYRWMAEAPAISDAPVAAPPDTSPSAAR